MPKIIKLISNTKTKILRTIFAYKSQQLLWITTNDWLTDMYELLLITLSNYQLFKLVTQNIEWELLFFSFMNHLLGRLCVRDTSPLSFPKTGEPDVQIRVNCGLINVSVDLAIGELFGSDDYKDSLSKLE